MNISQMFWIKVSVGSMAFATYLGLMIYEMYSGKPLPTDARTLMTAAFGVITGVISHLMTIQKKEEDSKSADTKRLESQAQ